MRKTISSILSIVLIISIFCFSSVAAFAEEGTDLSMHKDEIQAIYLEEGANTPHDFSIQTFEDGSYCISYIVDSDIDSNIPQPASTSSARTESRTLTNHYYNSQGTHLYEVSVYGLFSINPGVQVRCTYSKHDYKFYETGYECTSAFSTYTNSQYPVSCTTTAFMKKENFTKRRDVTLQCDINGKFSVG